MTSHWMLGLGLSAALFTGCNKDNKGPPSAPLPAAISVTAIAVDTRPLPRTLPLTGSLIANQQSDVAANASGRVLRTFVERGVYVQSGAALVQLDMRSAQLGHQEAAANLKNAETQAQLSGTECERNKALYARGAISKEEWERGNSQCQTSVGSAEAARARAEMAQKTLSDATVRAPFSGMIGERFVSVGEYVQASTKVVTLVELDPLRLQLTVGEADIGRIQEKQQVQFEVEAYPGVSFTAVVKYIDPAVRSATRDLVVEATVDNHDHKLRPGMFATAHLGLPDEPAVAVPKSALRVEADTKRLFAIVDGRIEERIVQTGPEKNGYVAVLDGLKVGDQVVNNPDANVKDGLPVK